MPRQAEGPKGPAPKRPGQYPEPKSERSRPGKATSEAAGSAHGGPRPRCGLASEGAVKREAERGEGPQGEEMTATRSGGDASVRRWGHIPRTPGREGRPYVPPYVHLGDPVVLAAWDNGQGQGQQRVEERSQKALGGGDGGGAGSPGEDEPGGGGLQALQPPDGIKANGNCELCCNHSR